MTAVGPVHATLVLIIPLCQIMEIRDGKTTIPKFIFPRLSAYPFLFQIVNRELNVRTGLPDLSDVAGRYLLAVGRGRIEIVSYWSEAITLEGTLSKSISALVELIARV